MAERALLVVDLGRMHYAEALDLQRAAARARIDGSLGEDLLLLVEHPSVITLGRSAKQAHLLGTAEQLAARGVELFDVERGGDVTYHGPGQLVGYPIFDLKRHKQDLHWYLRQIEGALIDAVADFGLVATRNPGLTGVWISGEGRGVRGEQPEAALSPLTPNPSPLRKLASIGVHARDWVTWHGFALNVTTDLSFFDLLVPCGIANVQMTSMDRESPRELRVTLSDAAQSVTEAFGRTFSLSPSSYPISELSEVLRSRGGWTSGVRGEG